MAKKLKYFLGAGILLLAIKFAAEYLIGAFCGGGGLGCLAMIILFETPGIVVGNLLGLGYNIGGLINIPLYFLIGGIIGLIIYRIIGRRQENK